MILSFNLYFIRYSNSSNISECYIEIIQNRHNCCFWHVRYSFLVSYDRAFWLIYFFWKVFCSYLSEFSDSCNVVSDCHFFKINGAHRYIQVSKQANTHNEDLGFIIIINPRSSLRGKITSLLSSYYNWILIEEPSETFDLELLHRFDFVLHLHILTYHMSMELLLRFLQLPMSWYRIEKVEH